METYIELLVNPYLVDFDICRKRSLAVLKSWIARWCDPRPDLSKLAPNAPFCVIGDIHGRFDLLTRLLERLDPAYQVICVGDYIDRGDNSAEVLRYLFGQPEMLCLMGNHEDMLLRFLDDPEQNGGLWLRNGGLQTLASFGVWDVSETASGGALLRARDALLVALGEDLVGWLRGLPKWYQSGNLFVSHAGANPQIPLQEQQDRHLVWGHPEFANARRNDGNWVLHGHTIVEMPEIHSGRICVDTGAYATGRLTAALVRQGIVNFIST